MHLKCGYNNCCQVTIIPFHLAPGKQLILSYVSCLSSAFVYCIVRKFGRQKLWQIYSSWVFGNEKFGEWIRHKVTIITTSLVWQIADDLPISPNFFPAKISHYTVVANVMSLPFCCTSFTTKGLATFCKIWIYNLCEPLVYVCES